MNRLHEQYGDAVIPLVIDLLDPKNCATLVPRVLEEAGQLDILHANAVMKNVHDVLPHMIERGSGDIIATSSLAAHFPTPWEPDYASSKWAVYCIVQTVRRHMFKHGIRVGSVSPGPVISALLSEWPEEKLREARESGNLIEASEVADAVMYMLTIGMKTTTGKQKAIRGNLQGATLDTHMQCFCPVAVQTQMADYS